MLRISLILASFAVLSTGCATISEDSCIAGSWESLGYEDGRNGESRGNFTKIAEICGKYGVSADATQYRLGYDQGLPLYCSYNRGFNHGEDGSSLKSECREINATPYFHGYDDGRVVYEIRREYNNLVEAYEATRTALMNVSERLSIDALDADERKRLRKKERRLQRELDENRIDIRAFERVQGWPKGDLKPPYQDEV